MADTEPFKTFCTHTPVDTLFNGREIITVQSTSSLSDAFTALVSNNITSAPVLDAATNKYTGFLDVRDLVSFIVLTGQHTAEGDMIVGELVAAGVTSNIIENVTVTYLSRRNPFKPVTAGSPLLDAVNILKTGVKRVPVVDASGKVVYVLSQSALVVFLAKHLSHVPDATRQRLVSDVLASSFKHVLSVRKDESTLNAFKLMDDRKITGLAIVDAEGHMVGNLSGKDLKKYIKRPTYAQLHMPVWDMLVEMRNAISVDIRVPAITVTANDTFDLTLQKLAATNVHRVFIADAAFRPVGVVTLTDVIKVLMS